MSIHSEPTYLPMGKLPNLKILQWKGIICRQINYPEKEYEVFAESWKTADFA